MPRTWKPTRQQLEQAHGKTLPDVIAPALDVLFVGINPSLYSAAVGHHFARPGNRFWPALHAAGLTDRQLSPFEDRCLVDYGYGLTNVAARATAKASELTMQELQHGARRLLEKIDKHGPRRVAFLGISAYRTAFGHKDATVGLQDKRLADAELWVLPNPSGLNAHYQLPDLAKLYSQLT